jgi:hypothetical protein
MKKFVVLFIVLALTCISTSAFATHEEETTMPGIVKTEPGVTAGVAMTFSGSIDIRQRFYNIDEVPRTTNAQERVRFNVDAKVGDYLNGRITIENDWDTFGKEERPQGTDATSPSWNGATAANGNLEVREAWMNFMIPGLPIGIKGGHQLLQLGNGWFFRDMKYGSDAWVGYWGAGNNTLAFYDVRVAENVAASQPDQDIDFYGVLDAYKLADGVISIDFTWAAAPSSGGPFDTIFGNPGSKVNLYNLGLSYASKLGPFHLKLEGDYQMGSAENSTLGAGSGSSDFKGYQAILQGNVPMEALDINFGAMYGSGLKQLDGDTSKDVNQIITVMDNDQHYTLIYEYLEKTAALNTLGVGGPNQSIHTGFANTAALNLGVMFHAGKKLDIGVDYWYLQAPEKAAINGYTATSSNLGQEVDFKFNWKLYDNLSWNWQFGWFKHGDAYKHADGSDADDSTATLGMLSFKF